MLVTFIGKHGSNHTYTTIDITWTFIKNEAHFFYRKHGESRTRYLGVYSFTSENNQLNNQVIADVCKNAEVSFCGWVANCVPWPSTVFIEEFPVK